MKHLLPWVVHRAVSSYSRGTGWIWDKEERSEDDGWGEVGEGIAHELTSGHKGTPFEIPWHGAGT